MAADFNKDGKTDLVSGADKYPSASTHGLYMWTGNGAGTWTKASSGLPTDYNFGGIGIGDLNKDGNLDIAAGYETWSGSSGKGVGVWLGNGGIGGMSFSVGKAPTTSGGYDSATTADIDKDGNLDIIGASRNSGIKVWMGNGGGGGDLQWTEKSQGLPTGGEYTGAAAGDIDGDNDLDIAAGNYQGNGLQVWTRNADGSWTEASDGLLSSGTTFCTGFADFNKDGKLDLVGSTRDSGVFVYLGNGGSGGAVKWTESRDGLPTSGGDYMQIGVDDMDGDRNLDIVVAKASGGLYLYKGNGGATGTLSFTAVQGLPTSGSYYGANFAKIDDDNVLDIVGATWGDGIKAWTTSLGPADTVPPAQVTDLAAVTINHQNIKVTWTATGDDDNSGTATKYDLRYSSSEIKGQADFDGAIQVQNEPVPKASRSKESFTITGLSANRTYYFALVVSDDSNNPSLMSNVASAKTSPAPSNPNPPSVTSVTPPDNAVVAGVVTVIFTFADADNDVNELEIYLDGTKVTSRTGITTTETWSWDTKNGTNKVANGQHTVKVLVIDKAGLSANKTVTYDVTNKEKKKPPAGFIPGFEAIVSIGAVLCAIAIIGSKGGKNNKP